ncbi:MAG: LEA type 2 family protein [Leptospirales bacterium]|nr:LEA type 2 family protein [Leptospirales bacterium]
MTCRLQRILGCVSLVALTLLSASCADLQRRQNLQRCRFSLQNVQVVRASLLAIELKLQLQVENPGDGEAQLDRLDFALFLEDRRLGDGKNQTPTTIPPGETRTIELDFRGSPAQLGLELLSILGRSGEIRYRVEGVAYMDGALGTFPLPFTVENALRR